MSNSDLVLNNREIFRIAAQGLGRVPTSVTSFGVAVTDEEAVELLRYGWHVKTRLRRQNDPVRYYLVTHVGAYQRDTIHLADIDWTVNADVVIRPIHWEVGPRKGIKAYVTSITAHAGEENNAPAT